MGLGWRVALVLFKNYYSILGLYRDNGKKLEPAIVYWGYIGIMEKKMETIIVYWGHTRIMDLQRGSRATSMSKYCIRESCIRRRPGVLAIDVAMQVIHVYPTC